MSPGITKKIEQEYKKIISLLFEWFEENKRPLPWRVTYEPYEVWISEMMLQQTQMERGVQYFLRWITRFPSVMAVANASESDILEAWEGLGYYSRAKNLYRAAQIVCERHNGEIPCDYDALLALPGIGPYTVAAIMGIAFEKDFATIDANVERVFSRLCNITDKNLKARVTEEVDKILPKGQARIFNQALMEFGALVCKKNPQCTTCPVFTFCEAYAKNVQNERPVPKKKPDIIPVYATFCVIKHKKKGFLVRKRPDKGLWANMWEFVGLDTFLVDVTNTHKNSLSSPIKMEDFAHVALKQELERLFFIDTVNIMNKDKILLSIDSLENTCVSIKHSYTNHRLQAYFFYMEINFDISFSEEYIWRENFDGIAMPSHHRKAVNAYAFT